MAPGSDAAAGPDHLGPLADHGPTGREDAAGPRLDGAQPAGDGAAGFCADNGDCLATQYCHLGQGCVASGAKMGTCAPRPQLCPEVLVPVCGCDGQDYDSPCQAHGQGTNVAHAGPCEADPACSGVTCRLVNDCCTCHASRAITAPPPCPQTCLQPTCQGWGLSNPSSYCVGGQCLVTGDHQCTSDGDCRKVDECCFCLAWPRDRQPPSCVGDCNQGRCTAAGLQSARPRCRAGRCVLQAP